MHVSLRLRVRVLITCKVLLAVIDVTALVSHLLSWGCHIAGGVKHTAVPQAKHHRAGQPVDRPTEDGRLVGSERGMIVHPPPLLG
jgi:hypothetical protein